MSEAAANAERALPRTASIVIPCYRDADRAIALVAALSLQRTDRELASEIIVVDDGSADGSAGRIEHAISGAATLVRLGVNSGRAMARNAGARTATGDVLLFLDSDCLPDCDDLVARHLACWDRDTVASTGPVHGTGSGFWARYQRTAARRMARRVVAGEAFAATAANLMVERRAFLACDGFDPAFRGYGFEDRDLLLRLLERGPIAWSSDASVIHAAQPAMANVAMKLAEAGEATAPLFRTRHPQAYRRLSYAAIDAHLHPWLRPVGRWLGPCAMAWSIRMEGFLQARWIPYRIRALCVRVTSALAFLHGTTRRATTRP